MVVELQAVYQLTLTAAVAGGTSVDADGRGVAGGILTDETQTVL